jgi:ACR3 family arsenite efflux pump ArsB
MATGAALGILFVYGVYLLLFHFLTSKWMRNSRLAWVGTLLSFGIFVFYFGMFWFIEDYLNEGRHQPQFRPLYIAVGSGFVVSPILTLIAAYVRKRKGK